MINKTKNLVLFSRCQLTDLNAKIAPHLSSEHKIIHLAFSDFEEKKLNEEYAIKDVINFSREIDFLLKSEKFDELLLNDIDDLIINQSNNRFNLNSCIQSDRPSQFLDYKQSSILMQVYYKFWESFISKHKVDFLLHENVSLSFNLLASIVLKKYNSKYISLFTAYGLNEYDFIICSGEDCVFDELVNENKKSVLTDEERVRVNKFLQNFRNVDNTLLNNISKNNLTFFRSIYLSLKYFYYFILSRFKLLRLENIINNSVKYYELMNVITDNTLSKIWNNYFFTTYDKFDRTNNFYYYPIHLEPEATVLYWADGIYKNQVKLIENIAGQLPPNLLLYVKDHPHSECYRDYRDYYRLKSIPNVKLIHPKVSGKHIIKYSKGLITLNGTSGFEALLFNKPVFTFGNAFYNSFKRVNYIHNIRDLRKTMYDSLDINYKDDHDLFQFVGNYLKKTKEGFVEYFIDYPKIFKIDEEVNTIKVANGLLKYVNKHK